MKKISLVLAINLLFLCFSCTNKLDESINSNSDNSQNEINTSHEILDSASSIQESSIDIDTSNATSDELFGDFLGGLEYDDTLFENDILEIGVNEKYNLNVMCTLKDFFWIEIRSSDNNIVFFDIDNNVIGMNLGSAKIAVMVDEEYYDIIDVEVKDDDYMQAHLSFDPGRLYDKTFTVFGGSISDTSITAYPKNVPTFWEEMILSKYGGKYYNFAKSGSTCGMCRKQIDSSPSSLDITTTHIVNKKEVKEAIQDSSFVYIFIGANDATYGANIGNYGDITDQNIDTYESFKGSYSYVINKIREYNPSIRIIAIGLTYSTWNVGPYNKNDYENYTYAKSRLEFDNIIKDIATDLNLKYIYMYDLWNGSNYKDYIPDGIHPVTAGYELITKRIEES